MTAAGATSWSLLQDALRRLYVARVGLKRLCLWRYEIAAASSNRGFATSPS
jgi:hypothetical protein